MKKRRGRNCYIYKKRDQSIVDLEEFRKFFCLILFFYEIIL